MRFASIFEILSVSQRSQEKIISSIKINTSSVVGECKIPKYFKRKSNPRNNKPPHAKICKAQDKISLSFISYSPFY
jgi:hypothetical protein